MVRKTINIQETQTNLKELLSMVREGTEFILTEGSIPLARLIPIKKSVTSRQAGLHQGVIWISDDFDEPLPEKFWTGTA